MVESAKSPSPTRRIFSLLMAFLLVGSFLPIIAAIGGPAQAQAPKFDVGFEPDDPPASNVFGNPDLPDWKDVTVENTTDFIIVNNADNLIFKFRKGTAGYNEIWENDVQIVADERWVVEYLFNPPDTWKTRGIPQYVEWEQPENYHVVVKRYYRDWGEPETTFWVVYDFYGGFRPKISVEMEVGQEDNYRIAWKASGINKTFVAENFNYVRFWNEDEEAIVFDYSDVYETFGDITEVEIDPWANDHKLNEYFHVGSLGVGGFRLDPNFGYENVGVSSETYKDYIMGTPYTCPESGTAQSMTAYCKNTSEWSKKKFAIYKVSDDSLVGYTEEHEGIWAEGWHTLNIVWGESLEGSVSYYLAWWGGVVTSSFYYDTGVAGFYDAEAYDGFPDSLDPTPFANHKFSIYVTYSTEAVAPGKPVLISPENDHSTSDNTPTFVWENGANATSHRLVIDNSQNFDDGDNIYDNASAWDNSGTAIENELPADNYWWKVCATNAEGDNWSENTWTFEITIPPEWELVESWTGAIQNPAPPAVENFYITDADNVAEDNLIPQTQYKFWVEVQDNDTLADIENVTLVVYLDNENLPDNEVDHYTFQWTRDGGFEEVGPGGVGELTGVVVDNGNFDWACARMPSQHKAYYVAGRYWQFYSDNITNDNLLYATSTDGINWTSPTWIGDVDYGAYFSVALEDEDNFHFARQYPYATGALTYRKGTPLENGDISWIADWQTVVSGSEIFGDPHITIDANGYPWIGYVADDYDGHVVKSDNKDGTWETSSGFPYDTDNRGAIILTQLAIPVPLSNGQVYVVYGWWSDYVPSGENQLRGQLWDGSSWGNEENVSTSLPFDYYSMWSATGMDNDVHVAMFTTNNDIVYVKRTWGSGWGSEENVETDTTSYDYSTPTLLSDKDDNTIWIFWGEDTNHIYYRRKVDGAWENKVDWIDESTDKFYVGKGYTVCSASKPYDNKILVYYVTETNDSAPPYKLKFAYIDLGSYDYLIIDNCVAGDDTKTTDNFIFAIEFGEDATVTDSDNWDVWVQVYDSAGNQDNRFFLNRFDIVAVPPAPPAAKLPKVIVWMPSIEATSWVEAQTVRVYGTIYGKGESGTVYAQVIDNDGSPINTATVNLTVWKPNATRFINNVSMTFITGSNGTYIYNFTTPSQVGVYLCDVKAAWDSKTAYGSGEFQVASWVEELRAENAVGYLTVTVLDNETNEQIEGAKVELYKAGTLVERKYTRWDGKAFLDIMAWDIHELRWSKDGYETETMEIDLAVSSDLTLKMVPVKERPLIPPITWILAALVIGCVFAVLVYYGSKKRAKAASLGTAFILPAILLGILWFLGVVG